MQLLTSALAAFLLSLLGCWLITRSAKLRAVSNVAPSEDRWHEHATPGLGGIPIFLAVVAVAFFTSATTSLSFGILSTALPLLLLGSYDDIKPLSPKLKLTAQILSAVLFLVLIATPFFNVVGEIRFSDFSLLHWFAFLFWLVALINAINLLDNMDGLSGGVAFVACVTIAALAASSEQLAGVSALYTIVAAALAGFLVLNVNPAKLFMGDAGTLWLGLVVGSGALLVAIDSAIDLKAGIAGSTTLGVWLFPIILCAVPICDTLMVMITRKLRGQAVSIGGKDHLSHRLVALGLTQRVAVAILWAFAIASSLIALLIKLYPLAIWIAPVCIYSMVLFAAVLWLTRATSAPNGVAINNSETQST